MISSVPTDKYLLVPDFIVNLEPRWGFSAQIAAVKVIFAIVFIVPELLEDFLLFVPPCSHTIHCFSWDLQKQALSWMTG